MQWDVWLAFIGASIAISISPGAGAIQSMATGLTFGPRRGFWSIAGLQIGLMLQLAFTVIKRIRVVYLVYLAVRQWRTGPRDLGEQLDASNSGGRLTLLVRGLGVNVTNPKGLVFLLAVLPQFVVPTAPCCRSTWRSEGRCWPSISW